MEASYRAWALRDLPKTKTVTRRKHRRILLILRGQAAAGTKFRAWIKAKGFYEGAEGDKGRLFVPADAGEAGPSFRKVAMVEDFFDILRAIHAETGHHPGYKFIEKTVRERYAFLPHEAVSRFVSACPECRVLGSPSSSLSDSPSPSDIDLSLPITATYLKRMRCIGRDPFSNEQGYGSAVETDASDEDLADRTEVDDETRDGLESIGPSDERDTDSPLDMSKDFEEKTVNRPVGDQASSTAINIGTSGAMRRRETPTPDTMSAREEDDDEEDDLETADPNKYDPERLKAFNMFVRLFVDENLDRIVPISRQPKEKVQAIMDSCGRQFPEFADRARKRIRTYLKSCRRHKRTRDQSGWEVVRSAPPHLTSPQAEQILAQACENETMNAKRMRLGLKPIPSGMGSLDNLEKSCKPASNALSFLALTSSSPIMANGNQSFKPTLNKPTHHHLNGNNGGATDLSVKRNVAPVPKYGSELLAVKQLIAGYRESAAFLLRSADELEHLLTQQQQPN